MSAAQTKLVLEQLEDGLLTVVLNRPDRRNALNSELCGQLVEALQRAAQASEVRAVLLTGAGGTFCVGGDVKAMAEAQAPDRSMHDAVHGLRSRMEASRLLHEMPKPTIAAINGAAAGAGLSIALACDLRIAADSARLITAFARVGFSGDFGGTWLMTRLVGPARAKEFYFLADPIGAEQALALGLVNRVVPAAALMGEAEALAKRLASGPAIAYGYMKANINTALTADFRTLLDREAVGQTLTGRTEDHKEAVKAFLEKRQPTFRGR